MRFFLFILCFVSSIFLFSFAFMVWKFDVLFVGLLVVVFLLLFFSYGHSKQARSLLLLDLYYSAWRAICDSYHGFYPRPEKNFHVKDCRSEGVVSANTLKRLVRKRKYKNMFS